MKQSLVIAKGLARLSQRKKKTMYNKLPHKPRWKKITFYLTTFFKAKQTKPKTDKPKPNK